MDSQRQKLTRYIAAPLRPHSGAHPYCAVAGDPCSESPLGHLGLKSFKYDFTSHLQSTHAPPLLGKEDETSLDLTRESETVHMSSGSTDEREAV